MRNIAEYCSYLDKDIIEICDLPEYILDSANRDKCNLICLNDTINSVDYMAASYDFKRPLSEYLFILEQLKDASNLKQRIGRRKLHEIALDSGIFLTEQQIRSILLELQTFGFVDVLTGRGGSVITNSGILFLKKNNQV